MDGHTFIYMMRMVNLKIKLHRVHFTAKTLLALMIKKGFYISLLMDMNQMRILITNIFTV